MAGNYYGSDQKVDDYENPFLMKTPPPMINSKSHKLDPIKNKQAK